VDDSPAVVGKNHEAHEPSEGDRRNRKEIAGCGLREMVPEEGHPGLGGRPRSFSTHVLLHRGLGYVVAQKGQFGLNPLGAPEWILATHPAGEVDDLARNRRSPAAART